MKLLGLTILCCCCIACVEHRATASVPADVGDAHVCINGGNLTSLENTPSISGHLPQRLLVHGFQREADGSLTFIDADLRTPLSWWQRFPADFITHCCWPGTITSSANAQLAFRPAPTVSTTMLNDLAFAAGYAPTHHDQE